MMTKDAIKKKRYGSLRESDNYIMGKVEAEPSKAKSSPSVVFEYEVSLAQKQCGLVTTITK